MERENMKEETKEEMPRYRELKRIESQEEYEAALHRLRYYKQEYFEVKNTPKDEILAKIELEQEELKSLCAKAQEPERKIYYIKCSETLKNKKGQVMKEEYLPLLRRNITALLVTTQQFELNQKEFTISEILRGILKRDQTILEALHLDQMFSRVGMFGAVPAEEILVLQSPDALLEEIGMQCEFVGIQIPERNPRMDLVVRPSEGKLTAEEKFLSELFDENIQQEAGKNREDVANKDKNTSQTHKQQVITNAKVAHGPRSKEKKVEMLKEEENGLKDRSLTGEEKEEIE